MESVTLDGPPIRDEVLGYSKPTPSRIFSMPRHIFLLAAFGLAACADEPTATTDPTPMPMEQHADKPMPAEHGAMSPDQMFIDGMVPHHEAAVEMASLARGRGEHQELKKMAAEMVAAQKMEIELMKGMRKTWFGSDETPPMGSMPEGDMPGMKRMEKELETLKIATPFDLAFIDAMIPHHRGAIEMAMDVQGKAQHPEVKDLAGKIIEAQKKEIAQLERWREGWYPTAPAM